MLLKSQRENQLYNTVVLVGTALAVPLTGAAAIQQAVLEAVRKFCDGNFRDDATVVVLAVQ